MPSVAADAKRNEARRKPCSLCGRKKGPGARRALCDTCRAIPRYERNKLHDPDYLAKARARTSARYHSLSPEEKSERIRKQHLRRPSKALLTSEERARISARNGVVGAAKRKPRVKPPKPKKVPGTIRAMWWKGDKNSVIRRKYPTTAALSRGAARGDFDQVAA